MPPADDGISSAGTVRATWLGHATVLAEVDSAVVIADPMFSTYASFVQWAGTKRWEIIRLGNRRVRFSDFSF